MKKLLQLLVAEEQAGDYGIEVEIEGILAPIDTRVWRSEADNSLRNGGMEYVMNAPLPLNKVEDAMSQLKKHHDVNSKLVSFSFRTSVHVHMNVQQFTYTQLLNLLYTYFLLEEPLMNLCGESRKGNRFCLRLQDAEAVSDMMKKMFECGEAAIRYIPKDVYRYCAINIDALKKYGSIEFRAMEGNLDVPRIVTWVNVLDKIKQFALSQESPASIYNQFIATSPKEFIDSVLEELAGKVHYKDEEGDLKRSFSLSIDMPFAYRRFLTAPAAEKSKIEWRMDKAIIDEVPVRKLKRPYVIPEYWIFNLPNSVAGLTASKNAINREYVRYLELGLNVEEWDAKLKFLTNLIEEKKQRLANKKVRAVPVQDAVKPWNPVAINLGEN